MQCLFMLWKEVAHGLFCLSSPHGDRLPVQVLFVQPPGPGIIGRPRVYLGQFGL